MCGVPTTATTKRNKRNMVGGTDGNTRPLIIDKEVDLVNHNIRAISRRGYVAGVHDIRI